MPARSKYRAVPTVVDNVRFASKAEARCYEDLKIMRKVGIIRDLEWQKPNLRYDLTVNGVLVCRYEADFRFVEADTGKTIVADCKGFKTPVYAIKRKLMLACHGIEIREL